MCCASRTLNQCYGSCTKLLSLGILLWRRLATSSMIDKFCLQPYNFHVPSLPVEENNPRRQLLQVSKCVPTICWSEGINVWTWDSGRTGKNRMFLAVTGEDRRVKTGNVFMVLDFPLEVGYTGKMEKETPLNDQDESATLCTIGHQTVTRKFGSAWALLCQVWVPRCWQGMLQGSLWQAAKAALCWPQPIPDKSNGPTTTLGWALGSRGGGASEIMCVGKGKMLPGSEGWRKIWEKQPWEPWGKSSRRGGGAPVVPAETPLQFLEKTMVMETDPLQPTGEQKSTLQLVEDSMLQQSYPDGTAAQVKGPNWNSPWRPAAHEEDPGWSRKQHEEEGATERSCYGLTTDPIPHPLHYLVRRG